MLLVDILYEISEVEKWNIYVFYQVIDSVWRQMRYGICTYGK